VAVKNEWSAGGEGTALVREVVAATPTRTGGSGTSCSTSTSPGSPGSPSRPDEPLQYLVNEPRRLVGRSRTVSGTGDRRASRPRRPALRGPVDIVLAVDDPMVPANSGHWHLTGDAEVARCQPTDRPADLEIELSALGAAYLGGASLGTLAAAGRYGS